MAPRSQTRKKQQAARAAKNMTAGFETIQPTKEQSKQIDKNIKDIKARTARSNAVKKAAATRSANTAAKKAATERAASTAAQRKMASKAAGPMLGKVAGAAGMAVTAAEIAQALRKKKKAGEESSARASRLAADSAAKSVKPKAGQSPTDAMRQTGPGRQVLDSANRAASKYTVKSGDTLSEIAKAKGTTVRAIMKASGIENADKIRVGQKIVIPDDAKRKGPYGNIADKELKSGKYDTSKTPKFGKDFSTGGKTGTVKRKIGGTVGKPKGCGAAQRGYGKVMKGSK